jgi:hypothetical protein
MPQIGDGWQRYLDGPVADARRHPPEFMEGRLGAADFSRVQRYVPTEAEVATMKAESAE